MFYHYRSLRFIGQMSATLEISMSASRNGEVRWNHKILKNNELKFFFIRQYRSHFQSVRRRNVQQDEQTDGRKISDIHAITWWSFEKEICYFTRRGLMYSNYTYSIHLKRWVALGSNAFFLITAHEHRSRTPCIKIRNAIKSKELKSWHFHFFVQE